MLEEFKSVRQSDPSGHRRWFADDEMDLIVWYTDAGVLEGFQLCYDKTGSEHAFTWKSRPGKGAIVHTRVDAGEDNPGKNNSPVLAPDGSAPVDRVLKEFRERAARLDPALAGLVADRISEFGKK
ncbi:MAG: hypothetical protein HY078_12375 [Elusimicrobia bacterium]|nr:hypothetical protein [Elusimicrobiota bacterium]